MTETAEIALDPIEQAIAAIERGEIVVVVSGRDDATEGALVMAAQFATPDQIAFFVRHTAGVICAPLTDARFDQLDLPRAIPTSDEVMGTALGASVDGRRGITTGISAADRATTLVQLAAPGSIATDFSRPGHIFCVGYRTGGVLKRAGHAEAAVDLATIAGCEPVGVLCEITNPDGTMARLPELRSFADENALTLISIADLIRYRRRHENLVRRIAEARIPTEFGDFRGIGFEAVLDGIEHMALVYGDVDGASDVLVRVHSECLTGDVFGSMRCDCGPQLSSALERISDEGAGVVIYLRGHEGRGIGLGHKLRAYSLQEAGRDTVDANTDLGLPVDSREYGIGAQMLVELGVKSMRIMTNNPAKYGGLDGYDIEITGRVAHESAPNAENIAYLRTKRERMGHLLEELDTPTDSTEDIRP